jgi:hypothetical protein
MIPGDLSVHARGGEAGQVRSSGTTQATRPSSTSKKSLGGGWERPRTACYTLQVTGHASERSRRTRARKEVAATPDERTGTSYLSGRAADSGGIGDGMHRLRRRERLSRRARMAATQGSFGIRFRASRTSGAVSGLPGRRVSVRYRIDGWLGSRGRPRTMSSITAPLMAVVVVSSGAVSDGPWFLPDSIRGPEAWRVVHSRRRSLGLSPCPVLRPRGIL